MESTVAWNPTGYLGKLRNAVFSSMTSCESSRLSDKDDSIHVVIQFNRTGVASRSACQKPRTSGCTRGTARHSNEAGSFCMNRLLPISDKQQRAGRSALILAALALSLPCCIAIAQTAIASRQRAVRPTLTEDTFASRRFLAVHGPRPLLR